ncbi:hypothetical protein KP509_20G079500 [Ceratopteris richardii]|uniref:Uncharacterized protein n=1 Tax=Ceratopteris richardii TaxID=49495 RepID=A0A8T2SIS6_CERRI|nr:hypothetical protein KP509_20G079500 [Ceratopteris richardii]
MLLSSLFLLLYMSYTQIPPAAPASSVMSGSIVSSPRRLLPWRCPPPSSTIEVQISKAMRGFSASHSIRSHGSPQPATFNAEGSRSRVREAPDENLSRRDRRYQQQQLFRVGGDHLPKSTDVKEDEKRFVPAGPNPLHNR